MKILKCIPVLLLLCLFSCSTSDDSEINQFIGNWELIHFKWNDCEGGETNRSVDMEVSGGCFFGECLSVQIKDNGILVVTQSIDDESRDYEMPYTYNESNQAISIQDEFDDFTTAHLSEGELVIPFLEDGCDAEYRMRKL